MKRLGNRRSSATKGIQRHQSRVFILLFIPEPRHGVRVLGGEECSNAPLLSHVFLKRGHLHLWPAFRFFFSHPVLFGIPVAFFSLWLSHPHRGMGGCMHWRGQPFSCPPTQEGNVLYRFSFIIALRFSEALLGGTEYGWLCISDSKPRGVLGRKEMHIFACAPMENDLFRVWIFSRPSLGRPHTCRGRVMRGVGYYHLYRGFARLQ